MRIPPITGLLLVSALAAQGPLRIEPCGGSLGNPISFRLIGKPNGKIIMVTSARRANISMRFLDPNETRTLGVGLEFLGLLLFLPLDGTGKTGFSVTIPNDPSLSGLGILHQMVSYPGTTSALDEFSQVVVVPMGPAGAFKQQPKTMSAQRLSATGIDLGNGRILIVGGAKGTLLWQNSHKTTEVYDVWTRSFTPGPVMVAARASHTQTRLKDGRYLLTGGVDAANLSQATCEIFDPKTNKFTAAAPMSLVRTMHTASLLPNGNVIVMGGIADMSYAQAALTSQWRETEIYNPTTNTWTNGPSMRTPRAAHAVVDMGNGRFLIAGGLSYSQIFTFKNPNILRSCEIYDATGNRMDTARSMATTRALMSSFLLPNGRVLIAGGMTGNIQNGGVATDLCQFYDPATNSWSTAPFLPNKAAGAASVPLKDGRFGLIGGGSNTLYFPYANNQSSAYNYTTGKWDPLPLMQVGRLGPVVMELQSCGMAVFGGGATNSATSVDTHELLIK